MGKTESLTNGVVMKKLVQQWSRIEEVNGVLALLVTRLIQNPDSRIPNQARKFWQPLVDPKTGEGVKGVACLASVVNAVTFSLLPVSRMTFKRLSKKDQILVISSILATSDEKVVGFTIEELGGLA